MFSFGFIVSYTYRIVFATTASVFFRPLVGVDARNVMVLRGYDAC